MADIQMGLFPGTNQVAGSHLVSAHTRLRADGTEVFVGEHLRWNRGRTERAPERLAPREVAEGQVDLFGAPVSSSKPPR